MIDEKLLAPMVFKTTAGTRITIGSVTGVNDGSQKQVLRTISRDEIGMLFSYWAHKLSSVYGEWDSDMSSSWSIRMGPYAKCRMGELEGHLDKEFTESVCQAWFSKSECQDTSPPVDVKNGSDMISLQVSQHEIEELINLYETADDKDYTEQISRLKIMLN